MSATSPALHHTQTDIQPAWLKNRNWDLTFVSLSVVLVTIPYLSYLGLLQLDGVLAPIAVQFGTTVDDLSRNIINFTIAMLIGGPHMYATFSRTAFENNYRKTHPRVVWTSILIPLVVIFLALSNLQLLLTLFFFWASIHVLHQIIYITEMYTQKGKQASSINQTFFGKATDYFVILTSLYPIAAYKMAIGDFKIGLNDVGATVGEVLGIFGLPLGYWMVYAAGGLFGIALILWLVKTVTEWQQGVLNWPKTLFIALTVFASFWVPALGNLDTAFQGMNFWHSLQYLALTWMLNNMRERRGKYKAGNFFKRIAEDGSARKFYLFNVGLTIADVALAGIIFSVFYWGFQKPFDFAFDRAYYIAVLSFLWIHYYHDHFLFSEPEVILD